ncbi:hypothetical protein EJ04DRAFT_511320, partial [Polyplosphaeria fusca]
MKYLGVIVLALAATVFAHDEDSTSGHHGDDDHSTSTYTYTGPTFNPSDAPNFEPSTSTIEWYSVPPGPLDSSTITAPAPASSPTSHSPSTKSEDRTTSRRSSSGSSSSPVPSTSATSTRAAASNTVSAPEQVSTGGAYAIHAGIIGAVAGAVGAGYAL